MAKQPRLGSHLEWHGNDIRVTISVPPSMVGQIGVSKLKQSLGTSSPLEAETLKWPVVAAFKARIRGEKPKAPDASKKFTEHALRWRDAIHNDPLNVDNAPHTAREILIDNVLPEIARKQGREKAAELLAIADGRATPLDTFVEDMITFRKYPNRSALKLRHAVQVLKDWCAKAKVSQTIEAIDAKTARKFLQEAFVGKVKNAATARDTISLYGRYWRWCHEDSGHFPNGLTNPFGTLGSKLFPKKDAKARRARGHAKMPFTDADVRKLLDNITDGPFPDFMRVAALTGMRANEVARLTVKDCEGGSFFVDGTKTDNAVRRVPIHPDLAKIVARRSEGKEGDKPLFHDLPGTKSEDRGPYAALSQRFTRRRRELEIGDKVPDSQQDTKDFHSFRRWFILKATEALMAGAKGFSPWTLAEVVGHDAEDGELPLGMTMSRYPGDASEAAKRACVEAVRLPSAKEL